MIQKTILLIFILLLNSCATLLIKENYIVKVTSNTQLAQIHFADSIYTLPAKILVRRSKNDLPIKLFTDTIKKDFIVKSTLNPTFIFCNLLWSEFCPVAYLIDLSNQKRYYYGKSIDLDINDTSTILQPLVFKNTRFDFSKKGPVPKTQIFLTTGLPWINNFYFQPGKVPVKSMTGLFGFSVGVDYFYSDNKFINISCSTVSDLIFPIHNASFIYENYENMTSINLLFTHNHRFNRFNFGYGFNYSSIDWAFGYQSGTNPPASAVKSFMLYTNSFGITTNIHYRIGKNFFAGIIYQPTFLKLVNQSEKFESKYEHILSVDLGWKIRLR